MKIFVEQAMCRIEGNFVPLEQIKKPLTYYERTYMTNKTRASFAKQAQNANKKFNSNAPVVYERALFDDFDNTFPTGMLPKVLQVLDRGRFQYDLIDLRNVSQPNQVFGKSYGKYANIKPYPYQSTAIDNILFKKRGLVRIACGGGKTLVAGEAIKQLARRSVFLVNRKGLLYQTKEVFEQLLSVEIGQIGDGIVDVKDINIVMIQSLVRFLGKEYDRFDEEDSDEDETDVVNNAAAIQDMLLGTNVVVLDECHCIGAQTAFDCMAAFRNAEYRVGLSATPVREDGKTIFFEACFGDKLADISFTFLIDNGFLVQPYICMLPLSQKMLSDDKKHKFSTIYKQGIVRNGMRNQIAVMEARTMWLKGHHPLLLVQHVEHGSALQQMMPEAEFLHGKHKQKERSAVLKDFSSGLAKGLIATTIFDEAIDIPACDGTIMVGGGASYVRTIQRMSRSMRLDRDNPKKDKCYIIDFWDVDKDIERHSKVRMTTYMSEKAFKIVQKHELPY